MPSSKPRCGRRPDPTARPERAGSEPPTSRPVLVRAAAGGAASSSCRPTMRVRCCASSTSIERMFGGDAHAADGRRRWPASRHLVVREFSLGTSRRCGGSFRPRPRWWRARIARAIRRRCASTSTRSRSARRGWISPARPARLDFKDAAIFGSPARLHARRVHRLCARPDGYLRHFRSGLRPQQCLRAGSAASGRCSAAGSMKDFSR